VAAGDGPTAVRLAAALGWYWWLRSMRMEGADLVAEALDVPAAAEAADRESLAVAYAMGALLAADTPRNHQVPEWFDRAREFTAQVASPDNPILKRLVRVEHPRPGDQAGGQVQPPAHAAGVGLGRPVGGLGEPERGQQVPGPGPGLRP
jgi:hypothetical protein